MASGRELVCGKESGIYTKTPDKKIIPFRRRPERRDADALTRATLRETGVSFCTGEHFGEGPETNFIRFAFSGISPQDIGEGCAALKPYFESDAG